MTLGMKSRRAVLIAGLPALLAAQAPKFNIPGADSEDRDKSRLPNGKNQVDEILKDDYKHTLADCKELVKIAQGLEAEVEKDERFVLSLASIKRTEDIEKLARRIRARIKKN